MSAAGVFAFGEPRRSRRPSLTPMIDVVFLLLVFFMLAASVGADRTLELAAPSSAEGTYEGAPRIVTVSRAGLALNGEAVTLEGLAPALAPLMPAPDAHIVVQSAPDATLQELVVVLEHLRRAGLGTVVLAE